MDFPIASDHALFGSAAKIERATKHISDFNQAKIQYLESQPLSIEEVASPVPYIHYLVVKDLKPAPPELPLIVGDAIHNLRSALDLLACQLVKLNTGTDEFDDISFPIARDVGTYKHGLRNNKIKRAGPAVLQIVDELQPYGGGKSEDLWTLHKLDIWDKHRLILVGVVPAILNKWQVKSEFTPDDAEAGQPLVFDERDKPVERMVVPKVGDIVMTLNTLLLSGGQSGLIHFNAKIEADIAFTEDGATFRKSAVEVLIHLRDFVVDTLSRFEPLFPPIHPDKLDS